LAEPAVEKAKKVQGPSLDVRIDPETVQEVGDTEATESNTPSETPLPSTDPSVFMIDPGSAEFHPLALLFPEMGAEDMEALQESMRKHGYPDTKEPVWLYEGQVLDGRSRCKAGTAAGLTSIPAREWRGPGSPLDFVIMQNLPRRHLTTSQKAALGVEIERRKAEEARERMRQGGALAGRGRPAKKGVAILPHPITTSRARDQAAKAVGVSGRSITTAKQIEKQSPQAFDRVRKGELTLSQAKKELTAQKGKARPVSTSKQAPEARPKKAKPATPSKSSRIPGAAVVLQRLVNTGEVEEQDARYVAAALKKTAQKQLAKQGAVAVQHKAFELIWVEANLSSVQKLKEENPLTNPYSSTSGWTPNQASAEARQEVLEAWRAAYDLIGQGIKALKHVTT
jgi:hypothetical protein